MSDQQFSERIERKAHIAIISFMVCVAVVLVVTDNFNPLALGVSLCIRFPVETSSFGGVNNLLLILR